MMDFREMCRQYLWAHCSSFRFKKKDMRKWLIDMAYITRETNDIKQNKFFMTCLDIMENVREWNEIFAIGGKKR